MPKPEIDPATILETMAASDVPALSLLGSNGVAMLKEQGAAIRGHENAKNQLAAKVTALEAEWRPRIDALYERRQTAEAGIDELDTQLGEVALKGFRDGSVTAEQVVFVDAVVISESRPGKDKTLDFSRAAEEVARFRKLVPGERVLTCSYSDTFGSRKVEPSNVGVYSGGILAEAAELSLPEDAEPWYLRPNVRLTYEDGTTKVEEWHHRRAIGTKEVTKIASIWAKESEGSFDYEGHLTPDRLQYIAWGLSVLHPLKLELPKLQKLTERVLGRLDDTVVDTAEGITSYELSTLLEMVRNAGGDGGLGKTIKKISPHMDEDKIHKAVAHVLVPGWADLTSAPERYSALQTAAEFVAAV